jgi:hypothetical protein
VWVEWSQAHIGHMQRTSVVDVSDLMRLAFLAPEMWSGLLQAVNRELRAEASRTRRFDIPGGLGGAEAGPRSTVLFPFCVSTKIEL